MGCENGGNDYDDDLEDVGGTFFFAFLQCDCLTFFMRVNIFCKKAYPVHTGFLFCFCLIIKFFLLSLFQLLMTWLDLLVVKPVLASVNAPYVVFMNVVGSSESGWHVCYSVDLCFGHHRLLCRHHCVHKSCQFSSFSRFVRLSTPWYHWAALVSIWL